MSSSLLWQSDFQVQAFVVLLVMFSFKSVEAKADAEAWYPSPLAFREHQSPIYGLQPAQIIPQYVRINQLNEPSTPVGVKEANADLEILTTEPKPSKDLGNNCRIEYLAVPTQLCNEALEDTCVDVQVQVDHIKHKRECRDVSSYHCLTAQSGDPAGQAAASWYQGLQIKEARPRCHEVIAEHCYNVPEVVKVPQTMKKCFKVPKAKCERRFQNIPRTVCHPGAAPTDATAMIENMNPVKNAFAYSPLII